MGVEPVSPTLSSNARASCLCSFTDSKSRWSQDVDNYFMLLENFEDDQQARVSVAARFLRSCCRWWGDKEIMGNTWNPSSGSTLFFIVFDGPFCAIYGSPIFSNTSSLGLQSSREMSCLVHSCLKSNHLQALNTDDTIETYSVESWNWAFLMFFNKKTLDSRVFGGKSPGFPGTGGTRGGERWWWAGLGRGHGCRRRGWAWADLMGWVLPHDLCLWLRKGYMMINI